MKYYGGCDVGSTYTKAVILDENGKICADTTIRSKINSEVSAKLAMEEVLNKVGLNSSEELGYLIGTGYGRNKVPFADENISEISCHAMGVHVTDPSVKAIIDIGGQDVKGISIDTDGTVKNFAMNDKCAAGTGRFLEIMADRLGISQQQMADLARSGEPTKISSMCTVFAESEVISLIGRGEPRENIARGVIESVVSRVATMAGQAAGAPYYLTGGLCENCDKFAVDRMLPKIDIGDYLAIHDAGAHGFSMGYNYNGKLRSAELLLREDGSVKMIRRAETAADYFSTFDFANFNFDL